MVGFLHLKESKVFLDNSPVLRVSKAVPEVDPEHGSGSLEVRRGLLHTGDKGPSTHWAHGENIEITVNM